MDETRTCTIETENLKVSITMKGDAMQWPNAEEVFLTIRSAFIGAGFTQDIVNELMPTEME